MNDAVTIRLGEERDAETVARFNVAMALETEDMRLDEATAVSGALNLIRNPERGFYLVADRAGEAAGSCDGEVVGSLLVTPEWSDWRDGFFWWVQSVYILPEFRRRGIYRLLYAEVKARAAQHENICGFRLYVEKENTTAQKTYENLGMRKMIYQMYEEERE